MELDATRLQGGDVARWGGGALQPRRTWLHLFAAVKYRVMQIREFVWPQDRIDHIDRHGVTPEEVEAACFGHPLVQRAKTEGDNPVCYVLGQTDAGRYLFCVIIRFPDGKGYPITARPMTDKEKLRYRQWKNR
jgi:uncharacterized DUF497 family protein